MFSLPLPLSYPHSYIKLINNANKQLFRNFFITGAPFTLPSIYSFLYLSVTGCNLVVHTSYTYHLPHNPSFFSFACIIFLPLYYYLGSAQYVFFYHIYHLSRCSSFDLLNIFHRIHPSSINLFAYFPFNSIFLSEVPR